MRRTCLALACAGVLLSALPALAGEARVTQVNGSRLALDAGSSAGLAVGMEVSLVRPSGEPIVHPITGENLGAPEVELGRGHVTKVSGRAATVEVGRGLLMIPHAGDVVRYSTPEDQMVAVQEKTAAAEDAHRAEHKAIGEDLGRLAQGIRDVQGRIGSLEKVVQRIDRVEAEFRGQLRTIEQGMHSMREDIKTLKDQVSLYLPVPTVKGVQEQKVVEPGVTQEQVTQMVRNALGGLQVPAAGAPAQGTPATSTPVPNAPVAGTPVASAPVAGAPVAGAPVAAAPSAPAAASPAPAPAAAPVQPETTPQAVQQPAPETQPAPAHPETVATAEPRPQVKPIWQNRWVLFALGALGIVAVAAYLYTRISAASQEDEEEEEDEELEEDEEEAEEEEAAAEVEEEEEDDIVVEDTSR